MEKDSTRSRWQLPSRHQRGRHQSPWGLGQCWTCSRPPLQFQPLSRSGILQEWASSLELRSGYSSVECRRRLGNRFWGLWGHLNRILSGNSGFRDARKKGQGKTWKETSEMQTLVNWIRTAPNSVMTPTRLCAGCAASETQKENCGVFNLLQVCSPEWDCG